MKFSNLIEGNVYSHSEVLEQIRQQKLTPDNPAAFTYNRVNEGMTRMQPYFEHTGRGEYKYIGEPSISKYTGITVHYPQTGGNYQIGEWKDGKFEFLNPEIIDFKQWVQKGRNGEKIIAFNSKVTVRIGENIVKYTIKETEVKDDFDGDYKVISNTSKLGNLLIGRKAADSFMFGNSEVSILEID